MYPRFSKSLSDDSVESFKLDVQVEASGFGKAEAKALEDYMNGLKASGEMDEEEEEDSEDEDEDESGEEEEGEEEEEEGGETRAEEVERLAREAREEKDAEESAPQLVPATPEEESAEAGPSTTTSIITDSLSTIATTVTDSISSLTTSIANLTTSNVPDATSPPTDSAAPPILPQDLSDSPPAPLRPLPAFHLAPSSPTGSVSPSLFSTATRSSRRPPTSAEDVRETITNDLVKERARTEAKHHARAGISKAGKAKGSESPYFARLICSGLFENFVLTQSRATFFILISQPRRGTRAARD